MGLNLWFNYLYLMNVIMRGCIWKNNKITYEIHYVTVIFWISKILTVKKLKFIKFGFLNKTYHQNRTKTIKWSFNIITDHRKRSKTYVSWNCFSLKYVTVKNLNFKIITVKFQFSCPNVCSNRTHVIRRLLSWS